MNSQNIMLAIRERLDKIVQEEIKAAKVRADKRMKEAITAISLDICEWYSVTDYVNHLEIRVSKKEAK